MLDDVREHLSVVVSRMRKADPTVPHHPFDLPARCLEPTLELGHKHAMYFILGVMDLPRGRGKWSNSDILSGFAASAKKTKAAWSARAEAAEIEGYPVVITEPAPTALQKVLSVDARRQRGQEIAEKCKLDFRNGRWYVPSQSGPGWYVRRAVRERAATCLPR